MTTRTMSHPSQSRRERGRGWRGPVLALVVVLLALGGLYVGAAYALADRVPFNTTAAGAPVGGRSAAEATALLEAEVGERAAAPVEVSVEADVDSIDPQQAGLSVDAAATVDPVTGFSLAPGRMWRHVVGAGRLELATQVDPAALPLMGGEDFSYMLEKKPGAFIFIGNGDSAALHHPAYDFSDDAIPFGASYWVQLVETALKPA